MVATFPSTASLHVHTSPKQPSTPSPSRRTRKSNSPSAAHKVIDGGRVRSSATRASASRALLGSFMRALRIKSSKKHGSPQSTASGSYIPLLERRRSMPGLDSPRSTPVYISPQRQRDINIENKLRRLTAKQRPALSLTRADSVMAIDFDNHDGEADDDDDDDNEMETDGQYIYIPARPRSASIGHSPMLTSPMVAGSPDPFRTPPRASSSSSAPMEDVHVSPAPFIPMEGLDELPTFSPLSPLENNLDIEGIMRRRRVEKSRMKSLQILGPEAAGAVRGGPRSGSE